jgi:hypothetical protein
MCEPVFSQQEQGVVYLFSRYWDKIDAFKHKWICDIQTHFPDSWMVDERTGAWAAIEFEYALSSFDHHHVPAHRKALKDYKALYIVYWDHDTDPNKLRHQIKKHFAGTVVFVCLSKYFSPWIEPHPDHLGAYWKFSRTKRFEEVYPFKKIAADTKTLVSQRAFEPLTVNKALYRTLGFNKDNSEYIECDHWKTIHLFTTGYFHRNSIPRRLFVKQRGYQRFFGYFDIRHAFFIRRGGRSVQEYFKNYYFYPYHPAYFDSTCLVYSHFRELSYDQGIRLYKYLIGEGYALRQTPELIGDKGHTRRIDKIIT